MPETKVVIAAPYCCHIGLEEPAPDHDPGSMVALKAHNHCMNIKSNMI